MVLSNAVGGRTKRGTERETGGRRWLTAAAAVGTAVLLYEFSVYAPPAIRRALGKEE